MIPRAESHDNMAVGTDRTSIRFLRGQTDSVWAHPDPSRGLGRREEASPIPKSWITGSFQEHPRGAIPQRGRNLCPTTVAPQREV